MNRKKQNKNKNLKWQNAPRTVINCLSVPELLCMCVSLDQIIIAQKVHVLLPFVYLSTSLILSSVESIR